MEASLGRIERIEKSAMVIWNKYSHLAIHVPRESYPWIDEYRLVRHRATDIRLMEVVNKYNSFYHYFTNNELKSFVTKFQKRFLKKHNIKHIVTRGHAPVVERFIRTIKDLIFRRLEKNDELRWYDVKSLANSLVMYDYVMKSSAHGFTPNIAREPKHNLDVKLNLELKRKTLRKYPEISEGDSVRIYRKRKNFEKGVRVPVWSENSFTVENIKEENGQKFYYITNRGRPLLRHEILLTSKQNEHP
jgi:hypothetical protein